MDDAARPDARAVPGGAPTDPELLADRITEDVIQQLYASRQDLAEVSGRGLDGVDHVADQLLSIIGSLRDIATTLRGHDAGATTIPDRGAGSPGVPGAGGTA